MVLRALRKEMESWGFPARCDVLRILEGGIGKMRWVCPGEVGGIGVRCRDFDRGNTQRQTHRRGDNPFALCNSRPGDFRSPGTERMRRFESWRESSSSFRTLYSVRSTPQLNGACGSVEFGGAKPRRAAVCARRGVPGLVKGWGADGGTGRQTTRKLRYFDRETDAVPERKSV